MKSNKYNVKFEYSTKDVATYLKNKIFNTNFLLRCNIDNELRELDKYSLELLETLSKKYNFTFNIETYKGAGEVLENLDKILESNDKSIITSKIELPNKYKVLKYTF